MTISRSLILITLCAVLVHVIGLGVLAPRLVPDPENPLQPSLAGALLNLGLGIVVGTALVYYASLRQPRRTLAALGWHTERLAAQLVFGVLGGLFISAFLVVLLHFFGVPMQESLTRIASYSWKERAFFLLIGVVAATIEESLFRGNLLPALIRRFGTPIALVLAAIIFAAYHLNFRPASMIFKTTAGLVYGTLYLRHRALISPAVAHALNWFIVGAL